MAVRSPDVAYPASVRRLFAINLAAPPTSVIGTWSHVITPPIFDRIITEKHVWLYVHVQHSLQYPTIGNQSIHPPSLRISIVSLL